MNTQAAFLSLVVLSSMPSVGRAEPTLISQLVPSHEQMLARRSVGLSGHLQELICALPDVVSAKAVVELADVSRAPLDSPAQPAHVSLVVVSRANVSEELILRLVRRASPALTGARVGIIQTSVRAPGPASDTELRRVGPFRVAPASAGPLRVALGSLLASNVLLAAWLLFRRRTIPTA